MITLIFEAHSTSLDNEAHLSSGWNDVELSTLGIQQSHELGDRYKEAHFDAIFCSDLQRSFKTAEIAFGNKFPIYKDHRLRECDYGALTQHPSDEVTAEKSKRINVRFPKGEPQPDGVYYEGESYSDCMVRMYSFLDWLLANYDGRRVLIIGHRATQYGIEQRILGRQLMDSIATPWKWQPGWTYQLEKLA